MTQMYDDARVNVDAASRSVGYMRNRERAAAARLRGNADS